MPREYISKSEKTMRSGRRVREELAAIFDKAYVKVATMDKDISGFRTAGIWPIEPNKLSEDDFGPNEPSDSTAIEIPINLNETEVNIETPVDLIPG
ncbi:hypothetical protein HHI36_002151 [Cryptolaemus montrouzieri]|uniref:Uncharacterized protein n=1 Tax=Cryptolaemus montrouzieri TaxID=559131 RepID=A0ABD2P9R5_9CUCU